MDDINWSNDAQNIIDNDAKDFELLSASVATTVYDDNNSEMKQSQNAQRHLNVSWGAYFARKSPPMGMLLGDDDRDAVPLPRPIFNSENTITRKLTPNDLEPPRSNSECKPVQKHSLPCLKEVQESNEHEMKAVEIPQDGEQDAHDDDDDDDEHKVNLCASMEHLNLNCKELGAQSYVSTDRDSNSTQQTTDSSHADHNNSTLIHIDAQIKYVQRFYQFVLSKEFLEQQADDTLIQERIEKIVLQFMQSTQTYANAHLSAVTYQATNKRCTVLILFESQSVSDDNDDQWMKQFTSNPEIAALMDISVSPHFTQFSP